MKYRDGFRQCFWARREYVVESHRLELCRLELYEFDITSEMSILQTLYYKSTACSVNRQLGHLDRNLTY